MKGDWGGVVNHDPMRYWADGWLEPHKQEVISSASSIASSEFPLYQGAAIDKQGIEKNNSNQKKKQDFRSKNSWLGNPYRSWIDLSLLAKLNVSSQLFNEILVPGWKTGGAWGGVVNHDPMRYWGDGGLKPQKQEVIPSDSSIASSEFPVCQGAAIDEQGIEKNNFNQKKNK